MVSESQLLEAVAPGILPATDESEPYRAQKGPQRAFLSSPADIAIAGGARGGGKTFGLLMEPLRYIRVRGFGAVIFRRTYPQIVGEGGLWDTAAKIYPQLGAIPKMSTLEWVFPGNVRIKFAHMQHETNRFDWDGSQIPLIEFDQLEMFSWKQFYHLFACNRSTCGVKPYIRATCNPDPDHWLRKFLGWWIDEQTGFPIPERSGAIRWFAMRENEMEWGDTREELIESLGPETRPKSVTFVPSTVFDNEALLKVNPDYLANLQALPKVDRERLLGGNWNVRESAGMFFRRDWFEIVDVAPALEEEVRYWDRAGTEAPKGQEVKASWTAGVRMGRTEKGVYYVKHVERFQGSPLTVERTIRNLASQDGQLVAQVLEQDPGQAGKAEAQAQVRNLDGYDARTNTVREAKARRARPFSSQAEAGNVKLVRGPWNEAFLNELENFDGTDRCVNDQVDAASGAHHTLANVKEAGVWGR